MNLRRKKNVVDLINFIGVELFKDFAKKTENDE